MSALICIYHALISAFYQIIKGLTTVIINIRVEILDLDSDQRIFNAHFNLDRTSSLMLTNNITYSYFIVKHGFIWLVSHLLTQKIFVAQDWSDSNHVTRGSFYLIMFLVYLVSWPSNFSLITGTTISKFVAFL